MKPDLSTLDLSTAIEHLRHREYSALELTEVCLRQIERLNPVINAFITPTPELAVQTALQANVLFSDQASNLNDLILLGMPLGIKDLFDVAGVPTTAGSKFFTESFPVEDAQAVVKLKLSGGVIMGKTNTHEIALGVTGVNPHYGTVRIPGTFPGSPAVLPADQRRQLLRGCAWLPSARTRAARSESRRHCAAWLV